jgi:hypothetical protein
MTAEATASHADVQRLCRLASLPRATYYRHLTRRDSKAVECELRDLIQRICLKHIFYGYRRGITVTVHLICLYTRSPGRIPPQYHPPPHFIFIPNSPCAAVT